jgi:hypothetical protein
MVMVGFSTTPVILQFSSLLLSEQRRAAVAVEILDGLCRYTGDQLK